MNDNKQPMAPFSSPNIVLSDDTPEEPQPEQAKKPTQKDEKLRPVINSAKIHAKKRPGPIILAILLVILLGGGAFYFVNQSQKTSTRKPVPTPQGPDIIEGELSEEDDKENSDDSANSAEISKNITYLDRTRKLNSTYTVKEALNKFALRFDDEHKLIFTSNGAASLNSIIRDDFAEQPDIFIFNNAKTADIANTEIEVRISPLDTLEEFNAAIANGDIEKPVNLRKILKSEVLNSGEDFSLIKRTEDNFGSKDTNYFYAKLIDGHIYYSPKNFTTEVDTSTIANNFRIFYSCFTKDDGKEPFLEDKIINIPLTHGKYIKDANSILNIKNTSYLADKKQDLKIELSYNSSVANSFKLFINAENYYDKVKWQNIGTDLYFYEPHNLYAVRKGQHVDLYEISHESGVAIINNYRNTIDQSFTEK